MTDVATRAAQPSDTDPQPPTGSRAGWRRVLHSAAPALIYLGIRQLGVLILALMASRHDTTTGRELTAWDGQWFLGIAAGGYQNAPDGLTDANGARSALTPLAFFPGYPKVVGALGDLTGISYEAAAFTVALAFGVVAAYGVYRIGTLVRGGSRPAGLILVALFAASPMGVVLSMTYSESMFCACAAWVLVFLLRGQWLAAGVLCGLAGLVRITAVALVLAVVVAAVVFFLRERDARASERLSALAAVVLAPLGVIGYLWWAGSRIAPGEGLFAQVGAWNELQSTGWGSSFDGGAATAEYAARTLAQAGAAYDVGMVFVVLAAVVLLVICCARRQEWPLLAYGVGVVGMVIGSAGLMNSKARLLVPAFTLLVPVAVALARRKPAHAVLVLAAVAMVSGWFGAHALVVWEFAI